MQFHSTLTMWDAQKGVLPRDTKKSTHTAFYAEAIVAHERQGRKKLIPLLESEFGWIANKRPYYKVYPAILDCLCRLKLNVNYECPKIPEGQISIRFALDHEPSTKSGIKIRSLFVAQGTFLAQGGARNGKKSEMMIVSASVLAPDGRQEQVNLMVDPNPENKSIEEALEIGDPDNNSPPETKEIQALATRIALTVCMLDDDPEIITRDVLSEQQGEYNSEKNEERKRRAEEKAKNRGVFGWSIGRKFQDRANSPHYTNPHFAIRYTGPGKRTPKIRPVKGYWTGKDKLTTVPTGYMLEDGTEIENGQAVAS
jgi:hypothetical protein